MYSLVLMTALATGADVTPAPAAAPPAAMAAAPGCCGGGCYGSSYASCYGCSGSCHGMFGGHGLFAKHKSHGCCGGNACCGGGYACSGGCGGFSGGYGSTWGPPVGMAPYTLHGYNQGGMYGYGPPVVYPAVTNTNPATIPQSAEPKPMPPADMPKPTAPLPSVPSSDKKPGTVGASLKFRLPAETKLYIDGRLVPVAGIERVFSTPPLVPGQKYFYDVKGELTVNGTVVTEEIRVIVEAGAKVEEGFAKLFAAAEGKTTVAGK